MKLTVRELLERAHSHLLEQHTVPFLDAAPAEVTGWASGKWQRTRVSMAGEEFQQVCSVGAVLLAQERDSVLEMLSAQIHPKMPRSVLIDPMFGQAIYFLAKAAGQSDMPEDPSNLTAREVDCLMIDVIDYNDSSDYSEILALYEQAIKYAIEEGA